jgi:acyl dehydratase
VSLHLNEQYAATTPFGRRIAHGPFTMSLCLGLLTQTGYFASVVAWLGLDEVRASAPVFVGDTIHPEATVVVSRLSSRAGEGIWTLEYAAINQEDRTVMTFKSSLLVRTRG